MHENSNLTSGFLPTIVKMKNFVTYFEHETGDDFSALSKFYYFEITGFKL